MSHKRHSDDWRQHSRNLLARGGRASGGVQAGGSGTGSWPPACSTSTWYLAQYANVAQGGFEPVRHYLTCGANEGRRPCILFHTAYYLQANPDVALAGLNPLEHYLAYGAAEGRNPHPLFDAAYYLAAHPDVAAAGQNPLAISFATAPPKGAIRTPCSTRSIISAKTRTWPRQG